MGPSHAQRPIVRLAYSSAGLSFLTAPQRYQERRVFVRDPFLVDSRTREARGGPSLERIAASSLFPLPSSARVSVGSSRSTRNSLDSPLDDPLRPRNRGKSEERQETALAVRSRAFIPCSSGVYQPGSAASSQKNVRPPIRTFPARETRVWCLRLVCPC